MSWIVKWMWLFLAALFISCATGAEKRELWEFSTQYELERDKTILPKGKYEVSLFGEGEKASLYLIRYLSETGQTQGYGLETERSRLSANANDPIFTYCLEGEGGDACLVLNLSYRGFLYRAKLPVLANTPVEPYGNLKEANASGAEDELLKIQEVFEFLEINAESIWPGWHSWKSVDVSVTLPDGCKLLLTQEVSLPHAYRLVKDTSLAGRGVYINTEKRIPDYDESNTILSWHGNGTISGIYMVLIPSPGTIASPEYRDMKEFERFTHYTHEAFHCEQMKYAHWAYGKELKEAEMSETVFAALREEGENLLAAFSEKDDAAALLLLKQAFLARRLVLSLFSPEAAIHYRWKTFAEGSASYVGLRTAMLTDKAEAQSCVTLFLEIEPREVQASLRGNFKDVPYIYGMFWCLLLDRFMPSWKLNLLEEGLDLDARLEELSRSFS